MRAAKIIHTVSCHAEGEVGDVIVGGVAPPPGDTLWEQSRFLASDGTLRNFMLNEPRGGVFRHVNLLVPPKNPLAAMGFIIMEPEDTPPMSGSNAICVATVLLQTGILRMEEPVTRLTLEAPGGLVTVEARCRDGEVLQVRITNVPSFVDRLDATVEVEGIGTLTVDTAFGGDSFVLVKADDAGVRLEATEARRIATIGAKIIRAANEQLGFRHPAGDWNHISFCQFTAPVEYRDGIATGLSAVVIRPGKIDRSPTGTGCSARMAVLHARGLLKSGDEFIGVSLIGSRFHCRIEGETATGGRTAIIPSVAGRAYITGTHQTMLTPSDPWPEGYRLSDTWPVMD